MATSYAAQAKDVVGVLQMDMTNYDGGQHDMTVMEDYTHKELNSFNREVFSTYLEPQGMTLGSITSGYACSDHASWTSAGYPALMMSEEVVFPGRHTTGDTLSATGGKAEHSVKFARFGLAFLGELARTGACQVSQAGSKRYPHASRDPPVGVTVMMMGSVGEGKSAWTMV